LYDTIYTTRLSDKRIETKQLAPTIVPNAPLSVKKGKTMSNQKSLTMPKTQTPNGVIISLLGLAILAWLVLYLLIFGAFFSAIIVFFIMGMTTKVYTDTVQGFEAHILLNNLTQEQRAVFQGMNFKLPWETFQQKIDLRVELNEVLKDETYAAKDTLMVVKYVYTIRPDVSGDNPGEKIVLFASFEPDAIKMAGRAIFSSTLSDHYATKNGTQLLNKAEITKELFGPNSNKLEKFDKEHGSVAEVVLEDSDFDEATQKSRDMLSRATSFDATVKKLTSKGRVNPAEAVRVAKLMAFDDVKEFNLNVTGLENLQSANFAGGLSIPSTDKKGPKK
jgi:hypothetical protein